MASDFSSVETEVLSVCSSRAAEATVTVSVSVPTSRLTSTRLMAPTSTGTAVCTNSLNPCSDTFTSY